MKRLFDMLNLWHQVNLLNLYMKDDFNFKSIPQSRIATFDIFSVGLLRHHVSAPIEFDVTESR